MGLVRDAVRELIERVADHADRGVPSGVYAAISVPTAATRSRLKHLGRAYIDPDADVTPPMVDLDDTAAWLIRRSSVEFAAFGGATAVAGPASIPPEAVGEAIGVVRLAQRLAVVYGFDPEQPKGQMALWRALAAGLRIELPAQGPMEVRLRDVPRALVPRASVSSAGTWFAQQIVKQSLRSTASSVLRFVPGAGPVFAAVMARRRVEDVGQRMQQVLRRLAETPPERRFVEDAVEVRGS